MSMLLKTWTPADVQSAADPAKAFCEYIQQSVGIPYPAGKDIAIVRKKANEFFKMYPHTNWFTLCRVANWCKARKKRPSRPWMVIDKHRDAWAAGFIPELTATDQIDADLEHRISEALVSETREGWRRRLIMASSPEMKRKVYLDWTNDQLASSR